MGENQPRRWRANVSLSPSRKQKKELKKLQKSAAELWEAQQLVAQGAANIAREAGRQASRFSREKVAPAVEAKYHAYVDPYVEKARPYVDQGLKSSKKVIDSKVVPALWLISPLQFDKGRAPDAPSAPPRRVPSLLSPVLPTKVIAVAKE